MKVDPKPKTSIKISNSNKEEFKEQVTTEGEQINVKMVTMDVKIGMFAGSFHPNRTGKQAAKN